MKSLLAICCLALPAIAQTTFVVDIAGGTPYQQIQPAIDAAANGDIVEVRPGVYDPFVCGKALRILGEPGVVVHESLATNAITIANVATGTCLVSEVLLRSFTTPCICEPTILVNACTGLVVFDDVFPEPASLEPRIFATDVAGLIVRDSFVGPLQATDATVQYVNVTVRPASTTASPLVRLIDSEFEMIDGQLIQANQCCTFGMDLTNSHARLRVLSGLQMSLGNPGNHDFILDATSSVDYDPAVTFTIGSPVVWPFGTPGPVTADPVGTVRVTPGAPGTFFVVQMRHGITPSFICPVLASPGAPFVVPGIDGGLLFDGVFAAVIGCYATGPTVVQPGFPLPNDPSLSGQIFAVQGLALTAGLQATNVDVLRIQ